MAGAPAEETALVDPRVGHMRDRGRQGARERGLRRRHGELAALRAPVDAFFDKVLVNSEDAAERDNRLRLLAQVRDAMGRVADFSLIAG